MPTTDGILEIWTKQPDEVEDYDVRFIKYLRSKGETLGAAHTLDVTADTGITVDSYSVSNGVAKVWLSGGTDGEDYQVCVKLTTAGGREKHAFFLIQVRQTDATP